MNSLISKPIDLDLILKKEGEMLETEKRSKEKINKTVPEDVQKLFNELSKTYNAIWEGDNILLTKIDVRIEKPYLSDNIKGTDNKSVERIKTMVCFNEFKRILFALIR